MDKYRSRIATINYNDSSIKHNKTGIIIKTTNNSLHFLNNILSTTKMPKSRNFFYLNKKQNYAYFYKLFFHNYIITSRLN